MNGWCGDVDLIGGQKAPSRSCDVLWDATKLELAVLRRRASAFCAVNPAGETFGRDVAEAGSADVADACALAAETRRVPRERTTEAAPHHHFPWGWAP